MTVLSGAQANAAISNQLAAGGIIKEFIFDFLRSKSHTLFSSLSLRLETYVLLFRRRALACVLSAANLYQTKAQITLDKAYRFLNFNSSLNLIKRNIPTTFLTNATVLLIKTVSKKFYFKFKYIDT